MVFKSTIRDVLAVDLMNARVVVVVVVEARAAGRAVTAYIQKFGKLRIGDGLPVNVKRRSRFR